jgi:sporulation protein YlmC with PRC-barrel domain
MKTIIASSALAIAAASGAFAQDARPLYLEGVENGVRASDFIGKRVYVTEADTTGMSDTAIADADANWQDAGEISDMMISLSGDTEVVLVDFGGFLGIGEKTVALDMQQLALVPDADSPNDYFIVFKGSNAELESAPAFNPDMVFAAATDATMATDATTAPSVAPATDSTTTPMATGDMVDLTTYAEADLVGKRVYGPNDEDVGEISAVSMDADGKVAGAVVDVGGFLGMGEKEVVLTSAMLSLVPGVDGAEPKFVVNATQEQLETMDTYQR